MPIDPSILQGIRPVQGPSILDTYAQITQLQALKSAGEERRAAAEEKRQIRAQEAQYAEALQRATRLDPEGRPTIDMATLLGAGAPAELVFRAQQSLDENAKRLADLRTSTLTASEKAKQYLGGMGAIVKDAGYNPNVYGPALIAAKAAGALTAEQFDQLVHEATVDETAIQRNSDAAIQAAAVTGAAPKLEQITTVDAEGRPVTQFVTPTAGASYLQAPKAGDTPALGTLGDYLAREARAVGRPVVALTPAQVLKAKAAFEAAGRAPAGPRDERIVSVIGPDGKPVYVRESQAVGKTPGSAGGPGGGATLSAGQQEDIATMLTVEQLVQDIQAIDQQAGNLPGVGPTEGRFFASARGSGGAVGETLRNTIGNIQGTIAKLRGGTSFTPSEQALLDTYTPTTTDTDAAIRTKLVSLTDFIQKKRANTLRVASGQYELPPRAPTSSTGGATAAAPSGPVKIGRFEVEVR